MAICLHQTFHTSTLRPSELNLLWKFSEMLWIIKIWVRVIRTSGLTVRIGLELFRWRIAVLRCWVQVSSTVFDWFFFSPESKNPQLSSDHSEKLNQQSFITARSLAYYASSPSSLSSRYLYLYCIHYSRLFRSTPDRTRPDSEPDRIDQHLKSNMEISNIFSLLSFLVTASLRYK